MNESTTVYSPPVRHYNYFNSVYKYSSSFWGPYTRYGSSKFSSRHAARRTGLQANLKNRQNRFRSDATAELWIGATSV